MPPEDLADDRETILVVDDTPEILQATSRVAAQAGYRVVEARSGSECLAQVRRHAPDVVLLDVVLPDADGMALAARIKTDPHTRHTFVILLSGKKTATADKADGLNRGADGYIARPVSNQELNARIQAFVRIHRAEKALRASRESLRVTLDSIGDGVIATDLEGCVTRMNPVAEALTGWTEAEAQGRPFETVFRIVAEKDRAPLPSPVEAALRQGVIVGLSNHTLLIARDGREIPIADSAAPIRDEGGRIRGVVLVFRDQSAERAAQEALRRIEWLLTRMPEAHLEASAPPYGDLVALNTDGRILNAVGASMLADIASDYLDLLETSTAVYERDGAYALGIFSSGWCRFLDVASRRLCATADNREALACGRWLCHESCWSRASKVAIQTGQPVDVPCAGGLHIYALPIFAGEEIVGSINFGYGDPPCDAARVDEIAARFDVRAEALRRHAEAYLSRPPFIVEVAKKRLAASARLIGEIVVRKQTEAALRQSEAKYHGMIVNLMEGFYTASPDGRLIEYNTEFTRILKLDPEKDHAGLPLPDFWQDPQDRAAYVEALTARGFVQSYELRAKRADGEAIFVLANARLVRDEQGEPVRIEGSFLDTTERRRLEEQLRQAQKMEAIGRLAGGVAHDFNNMLSVIGGYAELAMEKTAPDDPLQEDLQEIFHAAQRSSEITRQLLAFARRQTIAPRVLELNATVENLLRMLRRLIGEDIDLAWRPGADLWPVRVDPSQIDQVLANLCVNARDAIGGVGRVTIETGNARFDKDYCNVHAGFLPGDFIMLAVSDDGCGMPAETIETIFEPFFTTKALGAGTGLGLATVYGIVKQNDGFINVYSEPDKGTTFKLYLPRHAPPPSRTSAEPAVPTPRGRGETVLLVEDEAAILGLGRRMLQRLGYRVLAGATPAEALRLAEDHRNAVDLLIVDVVMPEMNGRELADRLCTRYPGLKVLFMSGYTADVIAHRGVLDDGVAFMQKPFSQTELAQKVREAMEGG